MTTRLHALPPISVTTRCKPSEYAKLEALAAQHGVSVSRMLYVCLRAGIRGQPLPSPVVPYAPEEHAP